VVIGGGVGGCSILYWLARLGWHDVVLCELADLTSGSTFHSAGLVGQLRSSVTLTRMMMYSTDLYRRLGAETGHDVGWHEVGSLRLASTPERVEELRRQAGWAQTFGLPLDFVSTADAHERFQGLFDPTDVLGAVWLPTDGWLNPSDLTMALAAGARAGGAEIATNTRVTGIGVEERNRRRRVTHVDTDRGRITCEVVVNAGGAIETALMFVISGSIFNGRLREVKINTSVEDPTATSFSSVFERAILSSRLSKSFQS
jgi:4-methylaminobutanoate oxidase (formaldehyde-forming)